ncbi:hypothetical protein Dimus_027056 [Dionaea muscipula]
MHTAACKEFYTNLTMFHYKKKEVARSRVRGVEIKFDSLRLASILSVPGNNGIYEYIKEVWEESKYIKPLEITRKFANDELINVARRVKSIEMKPFQRENGVWWLGSGENRRRDDEEAAPVENEEMNEEERAQPDFDWEAVVDEVVLQGESGSGEKFYDVEDEVQGSASVVEEVPEVPTPTSVQQKETEASGVDPSAPTGSILDSVFMTLQAELERD